MNINLFKIILHKDLFNSFKAQIHSKIDLIIIRLLVLEKIVVKKEKIKKKKTKITGKTVKKVYGRVKMFLRKINSITIDIYFHLK